ncbi:alpha/beta hydrolase [Marinobacter sp. M216]|uniref:Alpha/beta hydrolase n=1 Tax=Marinobacter albus TaxID=3030833 RepID=A0ABT7HGT3_9GAMM|nr:MULTISPECIES: alpha/beta hydrolase [unclassified Marinobacter]MBW7472171.1 alpha/beta hydrolase [Marinobacter sp. F4218]MDK9558741.1 alpha/beta hydrolase [Marinobacter sp. M216]
MNSGPDPTKYSTRPLELSFTTRCKLLVLRWLLRPFMAYLLRGHPRRVARAQIGIAGRWASARQRERFRYDYHWGEGGAVAGHSLGTPFTSTGDPVLLWLHGGAFVLPAMPRGHLSFTERLCDPLAASAFIPDYRLAPANPFPAALDDCEAAYRLLLDSGIPAERIVLGGESAGGNLLVSLLYRIRGRGMPMPACAIAVSPALDLGRLHGSPSRFANAGRDAMLPVASLAQALDWYLDGADSANPEISPLLGECRGLPPTLIVASEAELLRDDSVLFARRLAAAGVPTELALWPHLPHAFPLLEDWFPEASGARQQITTFMKEQLQKGAGCSGERR